MSARIRRHIRSNVVPGAISTSEVINGTLSAADLASNSVGYAEIAPDAFNTEIVDTGFFYGIADNSIQSNEVSDNSLTGDDIAESALAPSLDGVSARAATPRLDRRSHRGTSTARRTC